MNYISSSFPYPSARTDGCIPQSANPQHVWLIDYANWQNHDAQFLREFSSAPQLKKGQEASNRMTPRQLPKYLPLNEIEANLDERWSKRFMPREFV